MDINQKLEQLREAVEKSDSAFGNAVAKRDAELDRIGKASEETKKAVSEAEKALLQAKGELDSRLGELSKKGETLGGEVAEVVRRMADIEKRLGRPAPNSGNEEPMQKSIGAQFVETMKSDQFSSLLEGLKRGLRGGPSVYFNGSQFSEQMMFRNVMKSLGIPFSNEAFEEIRKTTVTTADATRMVAPMRDMTVTPLRRGLTIRNLMKTKPIASNSFEYLEIQGMGPTAGTAVTTLTSTGYVANALVASTANIRQGDMVELSGVVETGYNGVWRVIEVVDATNFTMRLATDPSDDTPSGTILYRLMARHGGATTVSEGNAKPEARLKSEFRTGLVQVIANWIPVTRQVLDDLAELQSLIDNELTSSVLEEEERQILYGSGTTPDLPGILTNPLRQTLAQGALTPLNAIRRGVTFLELSYLAATGMVMNPLDWDALETERSSADEHYLLVGGAAGSERRVWRVPIIPTPSIAPKTVLLGAWADGATLYDRQNVSIRFSEHHAELFTSNQLAILAEERVGLRVERPQAFVEITLT